MFLEWGNLTIVNNVYFQNIILSNILINFDLFPKNDNGYFRCLFLLSNIAVVDARVTKEKQ